MFDNKYLWRHFEQDAEYLPSKTVFKLIRNPDKFDAKDLIINRFPVLKYRTKLKNTVRLYKGDKRFPLEDYDKGFIPYSIPFDSANFQMKILETKINYSQVESFLNMLREMKSSNIKMVFVMTPEYGIESKYYDRLESIKIIKKISQKYNIPFLNFNTIYRSSINEDITNFSDWGHMNSSGSELFSAYLTKEIKFIVNDENLMNLGNR